VQEILDYFKVHIAGDVWCWMIAVWCVNDL